MGTLFAVLYFVFFCLAGWALAGYLAPGLHREESLVLSGTFALVLLEALPALVSVFIGFCLSSALLALALAGALFFFCVFHLPKDAKAPKSSSPAFWLCVLPLLLLTVVLLHTHTLYLKDGAYWCGQSTYGDLPMHLAFIESIARQGSFPPAYSLLAGQTVFGYPFLCESVSSVFLLLGAGLKLATLLPACLAVFTVLGGGWWLAKELLGTNGKASLAYWLFFLGSGFGFVYFLGGGKENFTRIFTGFYETPTNYVQENIRWVNPIADMLVPQRATLFGWALLFPALALLARFALKKESRLVAALFAAAAPLPLVHTHSALALVMISAVLFLQAVIESKSCKALRHWLLWAATTGAAWLPQLFGIIFKQTSSGNNFLRLHFNWANEGDNYFWFYIKNIGLVYLLLIPAFLWAGKALRWFYGGGLLILAVSELIVFQPNTYDNNKLLFVWHLLGCILVANLLVDLVKRIPQKAAGAAALSLVVMVCTLGSVLTLGRELVSRYEHFGPDAIATGEYVRESTPKDALFLTGMQHLNPVASLAGANIMCGSTLYVYFHGMNYSPQEAAIRELYETPSRQQLEAWGIDYVMISNWERSDYQVDEAWFAENCTRIFSQGQFTLYQV